MIFDQIFVNVKTQINIDDLIMIKTIFIMLILIFSALINKKKMIDEIIFKKKKGEKKNIRKNLTLALI